MQPPARADKARRGGPSVLHIVTHPMTVRILMRDQLRFLRDSGFEVGVAVAPGEGLDLPGITVWPIPSLTRQFAPLRDATALIRMLAVIRRFRPLIVNASTPKAGLLGMLAARLMRVPLRIYTLRGLRLETARGPARGVLGLAEKLAVRSAHRVVCVSESLRAACLHAGLADADKLVVLGSGSSNGVDVRRFDVGRAASAEVSALRSRLGIPERAPVIGFVGRLTRDKGIEDLCEVFFDHLGVRHPTARLLLVGDFEEGDPVAARTRARFEACPEVVRTGFVDDTAPYYALMNVLVLPSYREGFPNAPLEAAACGLPVAAYRATGTVDSVEDGVTGTLVKVGDRDALGRAICSYLDDPELARGHGIAGRARVERLFRQELVWRAWADEYHRLAATGAGSA